MTTAEKLAEVYENTEKVEALNAELEQTLYGTDSGGKSHYDEFWDDYQQKGLRSTYYYAFAGQGWTDKTFKPKYNVNPQYSAMQMFTYCNVTDIVASLEQAGVTLDFSLATTLTRLFQGAQTKRIPRVNATKAPSLTGLFEACYNLESIESFVLAENQIFSGVFNSCSVLKNILFEGTIGGNGLNLQWSPLLTHDSLMSLINCLKDYSTDTSGTTYTVTIGSENLAKLTEEELDIARAKGWDIV